MSKGKLFQTTGRILRGAGALSQTAEEITRFKSTKVLIITDPGIVGAGLVASLTKVLEEASIEYFVYDKIEPDPSVQTAVAAAERVEEVGADCIIGIGGGSPIDIAKVAAILVTNNAEIDTMIGIDQVEKAGLPTVIVPTTAGTGSEVTPIAILSDHEEKLKKGVVSPYLFPTLAILDPELTMGLPQEVTAATGMDALIHAVEAYTSKNADSLTDVLARQAMKLLYSNIRKVFHDGRDVEAREKMLEGSMLAGMAFANAGVTAVHAFAYPIGAEFHIPHGVANSIMLTPVMEFNMTGNPSKFAAIAESFGIDHQGKSDQEAASLAVNALRKLCEDLHIPKHLREFGIKAENLPMLAEGVMKVTRLLANNPRDLTVGDAEEIYRKVL